MSHQRAWSAFFCLLKVNISLSFGYHPQLNGQAERLNQEITCFLRTFCQHNQSDWSQFLPWAEYVQNSLQKISTGFVSSQCVMAFQPLLLLWSGESPEVASINDWIQRSEAVCNQAHVHLHWAERQQIEQADWYRHPNPDFEPHQWVWLSTRDLSTYYLRWWGSILWLESIQRTPLTLY